MGNQEDGRFASGDRATAVEPVPVSPLRDGIPSAALRVLICGGRAYDNRRAVVRELAKLTIDRGPIGCVIEGGARGADYLGRIVAESQGIPVFECRANWTRHGKKAGPIRNQHMLDHGKPDVVLAFPGGPGTLDMIVRAERSGVEVIRAGSAGDKIIQGLTEALAHAQGMSAGTAETRDEAQGEARQPGPATQDAPTPSNPETPNDKE